MEVPKKVAFLELTSTSELKKTGCEENEQIQTCLKPLQPLDAKLKVAQFQSLLKTHGPKISKPNSCFNVKLTSGLWQIK